MTTKEVLEEELETEYFHTDESEDCCGGYLREIGEIPEVRKAILRVVEAALEESRVVKIMENPDIEEYCDGWYAAMEYQAGTIKAIVQSLRQEGGEEV